MIERGPSKQISTLDIISKEDFSIVRNSLSTYIALKTSSELAASVPLLNRKNHVHFPLALPIAFQRTRFFNISRPEAEHCQEMLEVLKMADIKPVQLVLSPTSTMAYALVKYCHQEAAYNLNWPSARHHHTGLGKISLALGKFTHILGVRELM